jgi:hypothetical protein
MIQNCRFAERPEVQTLRGVAAVVALQAAEETSASPGRRDQSLPSVSRTVSFAYRAEPRGLRSE